MAVGDAWKGPLPEACDLCGGPLDEGFVDGRVRGVSGWAIMCVRAPTKLDEVLGDEPSCFRAKGAGLGVGLGQRYDRGGVRVE